MKVEREDLQPLISVCMIAYNHDSYIREAIEGVLAQKTSFDIEIIIHDDASDDKTAEIIKEYERNYPSVIRAVFQTSNQYSKGVDIFRKFIYPKCRGKYIAFCECDDYWCDELKLERQARYLEQHDKCMAVFHNCYIVDENNNEIVDYKGPYKVRKEVDYDSVKLAITNDYPGQTASVMARASIYNLSEKLLLEFEKLRINGDKKTLILAVSKGYIHVLPERMSTHRVVYNDGDSWTASNYGKNLSGFVLRANLDLRKFAKNNPRVISFPNYYYVFHSSVAVLVKGLRACSIEDKRILHSVVEEFGGWIYFLSYMTLMGVIGIPLMLYGKIAFQ